MQNALLFLHLLHMLEKHYKLPLGCEFYTLYKPKLQEIQWNALTEIVCLERESGISKLPTCGFNPSCHCEVDIYIPLFK